METKFWIGVVSAFHAKRGQEDGVCAFSHGRKTAVSKLSLGDRFVLYAPKENYRSGAPVQAFVAMGTVKDGIVYEVDFDGYPAWVRKAKYDKCNSMPVRPLLPDLGFVKDPDKWGIAFRRSLFPISADDFALIEKAMK